MTGKILVGFSVNPEINFVFDGESIENKIPLESAVLSLAGSAFNTASALFNLDLKPVLVGLVDGEDDPFGMLMKALFRKVPFQSHLLPVLDKPSLAFIPINGKTNRVIGWRGQIQKHSLKSAASEVAKIRDDSEAKIRLALGITEGELELAKIFFQNRIGGINVLVPSMNILEP
jgi:sugar/nucleoside kinase (ribokinase family)